MGRSRRQQLQVHQLWFPIARLQKCIHLCHRQLCRVPGQLRQILWILATTIAASIKAALKPLRERLEATIIPKQRTIESLQAEFVAMRQEKEDEAKSQPVSGSALDTQEAKRLRTGLVT